MKKLADKVLFEGRWIVVEESRFLNDRGQEVSWEIVRRRSPQSVGIVILARLVPSGRYLFIKQFRHALNGWVVGFPAGVCRDGRDEEIVKELKEETGYMGRILGVSPVLKNNSGMINADFRIVNMEVDEQDPANAHPVQELEASEEIEVVALAKEEVPGYLRDEAGRGTAIGGGVWYLFGDVLNAQV